MAICRFRFSIGRAYMQGWRSLLDTGEGVLDGLTLARQYQPFTKCMGDPKSRGPDPQPLPPDLHPCIHGRKGDAKTLSGNGQILSWGHRYSRPGGSDISGVRYQYFRGCLGLMGAACAPLPPESANGHGEILALLMVCFASKIHSTCSCAGIRCSG